MAARRVNYRTGGFRYFKRPNNVGSNRFNSVPRGTGRLQDASSENRDVVHHNLNRVVAAIPF
jgi:hypothetical protein